MEIKQQLESALKNAMKTKEEAVKRTLRLALSSIKLVEIDKGQQLDDSMVISILQKEVKSRQETISEARKVGRNDLVQQNEQEIAILEEFLPSPLTEEELELLAKTVIEEMNATSISDMGRVMNVLVPRLEGKATGSQASQLVRKLLGVS